mmetsp:Transcript_39330/g.60106  ORF Transcript_39330/g.60106 Transcript_39330/m.60106 type:complete len:222 (-) Transcript_39330:2437-3102(-)
MLALEGLPGLTKYVLLLERRRARLDFNHKELRVLPMELREGYRLRCLVQVLQQQGRPVRQALVCQLRHSLLTLFRGKVFRQQIQSSAQEINLGNVGRCRVKATVLRLNLACGQDLTGREEFGVELLGVLVLSLLRDALDLQGVFSPTDILDASHADQSVETWQLLNLDDAASDPHLVCFELGILPLGVYNDLVQLIEGILVGSGLLETLLVVEPSLVNLYH